MKTIGLIGGMSWESTVTYYQVINDAIKDTLGGLHSAKILLYSVDFAEIEAYQASGQWEKSGEALTEIALNLEKAGAEMIVICTNTMHKVVPQMENRIHVPIIHISDTISAKLIKAGVRKTALLGTKYTMCQDFYKERLIANGIEVIIPESDDIELVNRIIYEELCLGKILESSRREMTRIIDALRSRGAQGVISGCTEIGLLVAQKDSSLPVFDSTIIHAKAVASAALDES